MSTGEGLTQRVPLVGRRAELDAIDAAISKGAESRLLYFYGPGGVGKTRLLEEVIDSPTRWTNHDFVCTGIIDFYHSTYHSPDGIRQMIVEKLDPGYAEETPRYFSEYRELHREYEHKRREGIGGEALDDLRKDLHDRFLDGYRSLTADHRVVLRFDTSELIQHMRDDVQDVCKIEGFDVEVVGWLTSQATRFPRTTILIAGRERPDLQNRLKRAFTDAGWTATLQKVGTFSDDETKAFLTTISERRSDVPADELGLTKKVELAQNDEEDPDDARSEAPSWQDLHDVSEGNPVYLALMVDAIVTGSGSLSALVPTIRKGDDVGSVLLDTFRQIKDRDLNVLIRYLLRARKGIDPEIFAHVTAWPAERVTATLDSARRLIVVKARPQTERLFLHDEVYNLFDKHYLRRSADATSKQRSLQPPARPRFNNLVSFYRQRQKPVGKGTASQYSWYQDLITESLYYEMMMDPDRGYHHYYARRSEEAIKGHDNELDVRLRDEILRFMRDHPWRVPDELRAGIDRDCAVRWVKRYVAQGDSEGAIRIAENIRYSDNPTFAWDSVDDPQYKADLLTIWGEAMLYTGKSPNMIRKQLQSAVEHLGDQPDDENRQWWWSRILGRAYNNIGFSYRVEGRYGLALDPYRRALRFFRDVNIRDELADTRNNQAFCLAQLGQVELADQQVRRALNIREEIDRQYPLALSHNTRGRIFVLYDKPDAGNNECKIALDIFRELGDLRGIGLASNALGLTLRKSGDRWKEGKTVHPPEDAHSDFEAARRHLQRAVDVFSRKVSEPFRLWEAYNELGSLYCDWAWFSREQAQYELSNEQYKHSIDYQNEAVAIAEEYGYKYNLADSYDDLAQVYSDRHFLLLEQGIDEEAQVSMQKAQECLEKAERSVPEEYKLVTGQGFLDEVQRGDAYLLVLGKGHLQRGIWAFRHLEYRELSDEEQRAQAEEGIRHFALATAYFHQYSPDAFALRQSLYAFAGRLANVRFSSERARSIVEEVENQFNLELAPLSRTIDEVMGI